mgnify:CR=1 FL=1
MAWSAGKSMDTWVNVIDILCKLFNTYVFTTGCCCYGMTYGSSKIQYSIHCRYSD